MSGPSTSPFDASRSPSSPAGVPRAYKWESEVECLGLLCGAPFLLLMGATDTLWIAYLGLAGFGLFRGVYDSNLFAALFDVIEPKYRATATGLMLSVAFVIAAAAPVLLGWLKQHLDLSNGISGLSFVYLGSSLLVFVALRCFFRKDYHVLNNVL